MNNYVLHPTPDRSSAVETALQEAEQMMAVRFTLHDLSSVFVDAEGRSLLGRWRGSHRRHRCCAAGYSKRCLSHCYRMVNRKAAERRQPFPHQCWKGIVEIALPLRREGVHVGTLFAGQWRANHDVAEGVGVDGFVRDEIRRLPCVDGMDLHRLATVLETWTAGLLEQAAGLRWTDGAMTSRREAVYRYLDLHAAEPVGLPDLARFINLSTSRTSHLVRELTGSNFQTLRIKERLRKATALLRSTDLTIAEIGRLVGIDDAGYFSRLFRSRQGMTPGEYRKRGPCPKPPPDLANLTGRHSKGT